MMKKLFVVFALFVLVSAPVLAGGVRVRGATLDGHKGWGDDGVTTQGFLFNK